MIPSRTWRLFGLLASLGLACANRGMEVPGTGGGLGTGGIDLGTGGTVTGGTTGSGGAAGAPSTGGRGGAAGSGGPAGSGGTATGGVPATGGTIGQGGTVGTGGTAGMVGSGGASGAAGTSATGGVGGGGAGGAPSTGGASGAAGGRGGGGGGGAAGSGMYTCPGGGTLDCSTAGALKLPTGQVTDFSPAQWNATSAQWCDADGLRGRTFDFIGPSSMSTAAVDSTARNLRLDVTAKDWAGGGVVFESCVNASAFTSLQFTASVASGSLSGCSWQVQLQTQDQRATGDPDPSGGTCASNCYRYPAALNLAVPPTGGMTYTVAFSSFNNPAGSARAAATQVVGVQWQVNSSTTNGCTAQLRIDNIKFQ